MAINRPGANQSGSVPQRSAESSGRTEPLWLTAAIYLLPTMVLALPLFGLVVSDFVRDLKKPVKTVAVEDEPLAMPAGFDPAKGPAKAQVLDEPDEVVAQPAKFTIQDEPEERVAKAGPVKVEIKDEPGEGGGGAAPVPTDKTPLVRYTPTAPPVFFGISTTEHAPSPNKRLTFAGNGNSNSTTVRIDNSPVAFGVSGGRWVRTNLPRLEDGITPLPDAISPSHSTWAVGNLLFHQVLEIVPGQAGGHGAAARRQYDTVVVRWIIHNRDKRNHRLGLRLQLDTLIGGNDGVPFTVPGRPGLVNTFADFNSAREVPDFVQALEVGNLKNPGTVAHLTLKLGASIEPPDRLSLTRWPAFNYYNWEVPVVPMGTDSAAVMYWADKALNPEEKRVIGFSYGLGNVSYSDKLGLTLGGSFEPGQHFTATAYVENPAPGQTLRLELPAGLKRVDGPETQSVPAAKAGAPSLVTWKVEVEQTGTFRLVVHSSTGISQAKTISIARPDTPTGKLAIDLKGDFDREHGFEVLARVGDPVAGQTLTLTLPPGLVREEGEAVQRVPMPAAGESEAKIRWKVKVLATGKFPVRVASSTGIAQTKTITIAPQSSAAANFKLALDGEFAPGKTFAITAQVTNPAPDQKLSLQLPAGLEPAGGPAEQAVPPGASASLRWSVKVLRPGKFSLGVASSTGITQKKSLVIEASQKEAGPFTFELVGDIRVGQAFEVVARVPETVAGQTLTLTLPPELKLMDGTARQALGSVGTPATVRWRVQVARIGRLPVRIESSTGLVRTKTIVLTASSDSTLFGQ